jgi:hypothetical protein
VLFVDQGRLVASGAHLDLLGTQPAYARIVRAYEAGDAA